jgi:hypothetical protein
MNEEALALAPYSSDPTHVMHPPQPGVNRLIPVDLGKGVIEHMMECDLDRTSGEDETDNEIAAWVEYRLPGTSTLVHRSAHVHLKKAMVFGEGKAAVMG